MYIWEIRLGLRIVCFIMIVRSYNKSHGQGMENKLIYTYENIQNLIAPVS